MTDVHSEQQLDYSQASGSVGTADYDGETPIEHDGRADTDTTFHPQEADDTDLFERLRRHQDQAPDGAATNRVDKLRDTATYCAQLRLTDYQKRRVLYVVDEVAVDNHGASTEAVALATIVAVCAEDGRLVTIGDDGTRYTELRRALGVPSRQVNTARRSLLDTDHFDADPI